MSEWIDIEKEEPKHLQKIMIKGHFPFLVDVVFHQLENGYDFLRESKLNPGTYQSFYGVTHWRNDE